MQEIRIGILNVNTLTASKMKRIMEIYVDEEYDIIWLVDTRLTTSEKMRMTI